MDIEKGQPAGVFGYAAGKSVIAKKLVKLFPEHKEYVEPFCGSAALFFSKDAVAKEALNDRDTEVIGALKAIQKISKRELDALASKNWTASAKTFAKVRDASPTDRVGQLYKFLYVIRCSYAKNRKSFNPDIEGKDVGARMIKRIEKAQPRIKHTIITAGDYEKAIKAHDGPDAFHFLDPPYGGYSRGDGIGEKEFDETRFRKVLESIKGRFLLTYGTKGKLDTSGYEMKRMRQHRYAQSMHTNRTGESSGSNVLTHLLVSNFKVAKKNLGPDLEFCDGDDERGSKTMVSVPADVASKRAPQEGTAALVLFGKRCELVLSLGDEAWAFDAQRVGVDLFGDAASIAKNFSTNGSRFFAAMSTGVGARLRKNAEFYDGDVQVVALTDLKFERGIARDSVREFFISKADDLDGVLRLDLSADQHLGAKYPWLATLYDRWPSAIHDFTVLKMGEPLPPEGESGLPSSLESSVPAEFRFWTMKGDDAIKARAALVASKLLASSNVALVDGELTRVVQTFALPESSDLVFDAGGDCFDWTVAKATSILPEGMALAEVFSPDRDALLKASRSGAIYCDASDASASTLDVLAKALLAREGEYVVCADDSDDARTSLAQLGPVFRFRPGDSAPVDAVKRVFVASVPVRQDVEWVDKLEPTALRMLETIGPPIEWSGGVASALGPENRKKMKDAWEALSASEKQRVSEKFTRNFEMNVGKAEWSTAYVNDLPDSAFLHIEPGGEKDEEGKTKPRSLRHLPVRDKDGNVDAAHAENAITRATQVAGLSADKKQSLQDKARSLYESTQKARQKPTLTTPSDDSPDLGKADFNVLEAGELQPAQGERKPRKKGELLHVELLKADEKDERIVYGVVLEPDVVDAQKDTYSADEVRAAAHEYMEVFQNTGLMHKKRINEKAKVIESFIAPADFTVNGDKIRKGTWVMAMRVLDDDLWQAAKKGELGGFSIGGSAKRIPIAEAPHA